MDLSYIDTFLPFVPGGHGHPSSEKKVPSQNATLDAASPAK
jgi:hypothetical protein